MHWTGNARGIMTSDTKLYKINANIMQGLRPMVFDGCIINKEEFDDDEMW